MRGIVKLGYNNIMDFLKSCNWDFAYHGTPYLNSVSSICCEGWNVNLRCGQAYGNGEYFSVDSNIPKNYAGNMGAIILSIIIKSTKCSNVKVKNEGKFFVVNNTNDELYCLPVAIIQHKTNIDNCIKCPKIKLYEMRKADFIRVRYYYNDNNYSDDSDNDEDYNDDKYYVDYDDTNHKIIIDNIKNNIFVFDIKVKKHTFTIDITKGIQKNKKSDNIRQLKIEYY